MKYIALLLILLATLLVQISIGEAAASPASSVPPPLSDKPMPHLKYPKFRPKFSFECILGCTGACFSTGFQCFKKCFNECKNGRLSDETNFLPKFDEIRNYQKKENQKGDICKLPHTIDGPICKAAINRWSFDSR